MAVQTGVRGDSADHYIERRRRVALVSGADPEAAAAPGTTLTAEPGAGPHRLHPLLALPGLLSVAVRRRSGIDVTNRFAAAHALARLAAPGELLPHVRDPRLTTAVHDAAAGPAGPRRR